MQNYGSYVTIHLSMVCTSINKYLKLSMNARFIKMYNKRLLRCSDYIM
jgi:hypothetical protein